MRKIKYLLALCISLTVLSGPVLQAEQASPVNTTIEALKDAGVGVLNDGILDVSATQAAQLLKDNPNIKVLDVRTGWEYNRGHIAGAVQINYYSLGFKKAVDALDKNTTWLVHCKTGVRSGNTLPFMKEAGFKSVIHMDGGFDSWRAAKLPVSTAE
ncbi:rhodanese-like domain-containing protein [Leucothrix arctica]|uniref:Rhodanese-like domain-containing protein n=1 Tax=Leucothrix arctica TaxID=1481894 RepID=A0A317CBD3_9GAMM|nr:rhodanese-like domain-containing protein [Leucothrix arctica]PWQ95667.1 rhodanese-like domain-containing protein [Leucothrix arctica]